MLLLDTGARRAELAELAWLWIGLRGRLTAYGVVMMLRRRGRQADLPGLHPHQFRHTFAHQWLAEGGGETDLTRLAGWKSRVMLQRYGASAADARAREAHRRLSAPVRPIVASPRPTGCNHATSRLVPSKDGGPRPGQYRQALERVYDF
jgi:hypothetical protein